MRIHHILCSAVCLALLSFDTIPLRGNTKPNVIVVLVDDLGFSDLGCYGSEIETPHIDSLAQGGARFSQFYNTAKCHSSRICLLSGLYCYQAGNQRLNKAVTIAEVLQTAGYFTAMTGKWHLKDEPTDRGFMRYFGHLSGATNYFRGDTTFRLNGEEWSDFGKDFYTTDAVTDYTIKFIDEAVSHDRPFFSYVAYNAPHYPLQAPRNDVEKYEGRYKQGWDIVRKRRFDRQVAMGLVDVKLSARPDYVPSWSELTKDEASWEESRMEVFAAMVDRVDQNVGRLIHHLKTKGVFDNTLILFCSDNGACPFERTRGKDLDPWDPDSYWCYDVGWAHVGNTPFRWYKQNQHEGGISSPLIAHWPNGIAVPSGSISHQPGHLIDIMATCIEVAGAEYPSSFGGRTIEPLQGRSLVPILKGKQRSPHEWLYFQFSNNRAIRKGDWKLVSARGGPWELYDIASDRGEENDVAGSHPELVKELAALWHQAAADVDKAPASARKPVKNGLQTFPAAAMTTRDAGPKPKKNDVRTRKKINARRNNSRH